MKAERNLTLGRIKKNLKHVKINSNFYCTRMTMITPQLIFYIANQCGCEVYWSKYKNCSHNHILPAI